MIYTWFSNNLKKPERLSLSARPHRKNQAISWFRSTAAAHIQKMQEYRRLLELHGVAVEMIKTERPGYIVYEDEYQIAAYPLADTKTRKKPRIAPGRAL